MKTIEQYEIEIAQKDAVINEMMAAFSLNIDRFKQVLGKDPQYVYDVLYNKWKKTIDEYQRTTLRNQDILQSWSSKLDAVINVLNEVAAMLRDLDSIVSSQNQEVINASATTGGNASDSIASKISEQIDDLVDTVQEKVNQSDISKISFSKSIITAGIAFAALRILGIRPIMSIPTAALIAYYMSKKTEK